MQRGFWTTPAGTLPYPQRHADDEAHTRPTIFSMLLPSAARAAELLRLEQKDSGSYPRALDSADDEDSNDDFAPGDSDSK